MSMDITICREINIGGIHCKKCHKDFKIGYFYISTKYPIWSKICCPYCQNEITLLKKNKDHSGSVFGGCLTNPPQTSRIDAYFSHIENLSLRKINYFRDENLDLSTLKIINSNYNQITTLKNIDDKEIVNLAHCDKGGMPKKAKQNQLIGKFGNRFFERNKHKLEKIKPGQQIVYFGSSPIEWSLIDEVPLSFSCDVCRLPLLKSNFIKEYLTNNHYGIFSIKPNIEEKTWVLMCSPHDPIMKSLYDTQIEVFNSIGFNNYLIVDSKKDFISTITKNDIDILIIDSHGGFSTDSSSSFISIGENDKLNYDDVACIKKKIPIVFISACSTNPPLELKKNLANAFLENGSLSVVASYVPLSAYQGMQIICRIINSLIFASRNKIHANWLEFISHLMRTFKNQIVVHEPRRLLYSKLKSLLWRIKSECEDKDISVIADKLRKKNQIITEEEIEKFCLNQYVKEFFEAEESKERMSIEEKAWTRIIENIKALNLNYDDRIEWIKKTGDISLLFALEQEICQLHPKKRPDIYKMWINESNIKGSSELLYYTHLGRPDFIPFRIA